MARRIIEKLENKTLVFTANLSQFGLSEKKIETFLSWVARQIPQLCREIIAIESLLITIKPKSILMASDAHRIGRIIVQLARQLNIKTNVMQHGAPVWEYGYIPVFADKMMVWGKESFYWFLERGVCEEQLAIVGNPRFDKAIKAYSDCYHSISPKILLLTNPIDRNVIKKLIRTFAWATENFKGKVIIKLHPSETDPEWFRSQIPDPVKNNVEVSSLPMNDVGLGIGDIAVVGNSSAGIDAILMGAAVVNICIDDMPNPIPYAKYKVGIESDIEHLKQDLQKCLNIDTITWEKNRMHFLTNYLYKLDGRSTERALEIIHE